MTEANGHVDLGGYALGLLSAEDADGLRGPSRAVRRLPRRAGRAEGRRVAAARRGAGRRAAAQPQAQRARRRRARSRPPSGASCRTAPSPPARVLRLRAGAGSSASRQPRSCCSRSRVGGPAGELELQTTLGSPNGAQAAVEVRKTGIGRVIELRTDELPILPKGEYYELWFVGPGDTRRSAEPHLRRHLPSRRGRPLARHLRRGRRPGALPGAERDRGAGRRRPAPDRA